MFDLLEKCFDLMSSRLNMQFAHTAVLFLFLKELHGAISTTMFISILDGKLPRLGAFIIFMSCGMGSFFINLFGIAGVLFLGCTIWLSNICWKSWPSHQSKITQEFFLRDFLQIVQVSCILVIILYDFFPGILRAPSR